MDPRVTKDETGFHNDLTDGFDSEIIVKADFVRSPTIIYLHGCAKKEKK